MDHIFEYRMICIKYLLNICNNDFMPNLYFPSEPQGPCA